MSAAPRRIDARLWLLVAASILGGCSGRHGQGAAAPPRDQTPAVDGTIPAGVAPWQRACAEWIQAGCFRAESCGARPGPQCALSGAQLVELCAREIVAGRCARPDPQSFILCRGRSQVRGCRLYCPPGGPECRDLCEFACQDGQAGPDAGPDASPAADGRALDGAPAPDERDGVVRLPIQVHHLVVDRARGLLYATLDPGMRMSGGALAFLHSRTLQVTRTLQVGDYPNALALSVDGSKLWVGVDRDHALRAVALNGAEPVVGPPSPLPTASYPHEDLVVYTMVGTLDSPDRLVVTLDSVGATGLWKTFLVEAGVPRGMFLDVWAGQLARGESGAIFAFNDQSTGADFISLAVEPDGLRLVTQVSSLLTGGGPIVYSSRRLYSSNGRVVDVTDPGKPALLGSFGFQGLLSLDPDGKTAMMLSRKGDRLTLRALDTADFGQRATLDLGPLVEREVWDFERVDADTFVFVGGERDFDSKHGRAIYLVRNVASRLKPYRIPGP